MGTIENRLEKIGVELPIRNRQGKGVVEAVLVDDMLYLSAHFPVDIDGNPVYVGKVKDESDIEEAYAAARLCGLNILSTIQDYIGSLDRVECFVKVLGFVNCADDFSSQPAVINGASDLFVEVFGKRGQHARAAMGAYALAGNCKVSVEVVVKIRE